jgi:hypothetical protein
MSASRWIHLDNVTVKKKTDRAFLLVLDDDEEYWIPISQVSDADDYEEGDEDVSISISEWIAGEKGIA